MQCGLNWTFAAVLGIIVLFHDLLTYGLTFDSRTIWYTTVIG